MGRVLLAEVVVLARKRTRLLYDMVGDLCVNGDLCYAGNPWLVVDRGKRVEIAERLEEAAGLLLELARELEDKLVDEVAWDIAVARARDLIAKAEERVGKFATGGAGA